MLHIKYKKKVRYSNLTFHKDMITVKKLLGRLQYHDRVKYCGSLVLFDGTKLGQDYEFYDTLYKEWDSPRAFRSKSKTKLIMDKIILLLEKHQVPNGFTMTKWDWHISREYYKGAVMPLYFLPLSRRVVSIL